MFIKSTLTLCPVFGGNFKLRLPPLVGQKNWIELRHRPLFFSRAGTPMGLQNLTPKSVHILDAAEPLRESGAIFQCPELGL